MRWIRILLIVVAVVCIGVAVSYPIRYRLAQQENNADLEQLSRMREKAQRGDGVQPDAAVQDGPEGGETSESAAVPPAQHGSDNGETPESAAGAAPQFEADGGEAPEGAAEAAPQGENGGGETPESAVPANGQTAEDRESDAESPANDMTEEAPAGTAPEGGEASAAARTRDGVPERVRPDASFPAAAPATEGGEASEEGRQPPTGDASDAGEPAEAAGTSAEEQRTADAAQAPSEGDDAETPEQAVVETVTEGPPTPEPTPSPTPGFVDLILEGIPTPTPTPDPRVPTPVPTETPVPTPTPDRRIHTGALPYPLKEKVEFDPAAMLPELADIYALNNDLIGWLEIPDTVIDYPVVQCEDSDFYLTHDFYKEENQNGQIILDTLCDPYTPSYNLIISGHHMKNKSMFGDLPLYESRSYWQRHMFLEFDTLMTRKQYVIFACFYSADYDEDEEGFRYNADIRYAKEAEQWLEEVHQNECYDTGIDAEFGDEFITLTTCNRARHRNGRFVVVARKIREGEIFE